MDDVNRKELGNEGVLGQSAVKGGRREETWPQGMSRGRRGKRGGRVLATAVDLSLPGLASGLFGKIN